jgi:hypothetical protein
MCRSVADVSETHAASFFPLHHRGSLEIKTQTLFTDFDYEDEGSMYLRNVENTAHIHKAQNPKNRINLRNP